MYKTNIWTTMYINITYCLHTAMLYRLSSLQIYHIILNCTIMT